MLIKWLSILLIFGGMTMSVSAKSVHDFTVKNIDGKEVNLADYKGKVLLIVNVASKCGFTPQYEGLQALYEEYKNKGVEILGFPCNQFANQEPGTNEEIQQWGSVDYGVTFPLFDKVDVNGEDAHPLYKYLVSEKGFKGYDLSNPKAEMIKGVLEKNFPGALDGDTIKWNFTKFLIDKDGNVVERFESPVEPKNIKPEIDKLL